VGKVGRWERVGKGRKGWKGRKGRKGGKVGKDGRWERWERWEGERVMGGALSQSVISREARPRNPLRKRAYTPAGHRGSHSFRGDISVVPPSI